MSAVARCMEPMQSCVPAVSPAMQGLERAVADIAPTEIPVLLLGEAGSGKRTLAGEIHRRSRRHEGDFVTISPQAATRDLEWLTLLSGQRTVYLEEIAGVERESQSTLLSVLSEAHTPPAARVICSSRQNLEEQVRKNLFREDLYYRLSGVCLRLPPLRHRKEDIPILAEFFLAKYAALFGQVSMNLSPEILGLLVEYHWPGNVRELENVLKSAAAVHDGNAAVALLGLKVAGIGASGEEGSPFPSLKQTARAASLKAERELILAVLSRTRWNRKRAAKELQISYKALLYKLKQTGLQNGELSHPTGADS